MSIRKVFVSKSGNELSAIATSDGELFLEITIPDSNNPKTEKAYDISATIFLNYDDLLEFIRELNKIKDQLKKS